MRSRPLDHPLFDQVVAQPLPVRVRSAIAMIDDPRPAVRGLLEPVLDTVVRDLEDPVECAESERAIADKIAIDRSRYAGGPRRCPFTFQEQQR